MEGQAGIYLAALKPIVLALAVFFAFFLAGKLLEKFIVKLGKRRLQLEAAFVLGGQLSKFGCFVLGAVTALGTAGVDVSAMVAGLGLTGFALGFALKDALTNLIAGLLLIFYRPFRQGDRIEVTGLCGVVEGMDLRFIKLQGDGRVYLIPTATVFNNSITILTAASQQEATAGVIGANYSSLSPQTTEGNDDLLEPLVDRDET